MRMTESDLLSFLDSEASAAYKFTDGELGSDRDKALSAYMRTPYGNEMEGRSSAVSSDVFDAVEGMLPDLLEVFTASDKAVVFEPIGPEDVEMAEQVTDACNYVFYKKNNGFLILYTAIKDGLMLKTGGIKWYYEKIKTPTVSRYVGVDEMQIALFMQENKTAEIVQRELADPTPEDLQQSQMTGLPPPPRYTLKIRTVEEVGMVKVCAIPPEELHVSRKHNSITLDNCPYVAHVTKRTLSEVRQMGYTVSIDDIKSAQNDNHTLSEFANERKGGRFGWWNDDNPSDETMQQGFLRDEYVLVDYDGDGIAERRRIVRLGDVILENSECTHVPIAAWTPYILTHQFAGISVADLVEDFQRIHTEIVRQQLDNLYLANNQETIVQTDPQGNPLANIDDLLNRRPGGVIRERVSGAVRPYQVQWQGIQAMPMIEQLNVEKENRTGYTRYSQGMDADSLNKTARGMTMIMNASAKRMKLMARIIAEALVAPMFKGIFKTLTEFGMENISFRLNGKFVSVNPQEWRDQYDMTINVGIGTGDDVQKSQMLVQIAQAQAAVAKSPYAERLLNPKKIYNVQARLAETAGFKNPGEFWVDPDSLPPAQPKQAPPDPKILLEQAKLQNDVHKTQAEMQIEQQQSAMELEFKRQEAELNRQHEMAMTELKLESAERIRAAELLIEQTGGMERASSSQEPDSDDSNEQSSNVKIMLEQMQNTMTTLAESIAAPKVVVRDDNGTVVGIQTLGEDVSVQKSVIRDNQGNIVGLQ